MDDEGLDRRRDKKFSLKELFDRLSPAQRSQFFAIDTPADAPKYRNGLSAESKAEAQRVAFSALSYDEKLEQCCRPESIDGPSPKSWEVINRHLGTAAKSLPEVVAQLGQKRFGHVPRVGDVFCGGGSIPFEAARIGCDAFASDLSPVAGLLTWASLNVLGGGPEVVERVKAAQKIVFDEVDRQITEWGIEHNEAGERADAFLYCIEARCPECGDMVPLAPSWVIGEKSRCSARLRRDAANNRFDIDILSGCSADEMKAAKSGTVADSALVCPNPACGKSTPMRAIRRDTGDCNALRLWDNDDLVPRPDDILQERLYCIRWIRGGVKRCAAPTAADLSREAKALQLV